MTTWSDARVQLEGLRKPKKSDYPCFVWARDHFIDAALKYCDKEEESESVAPQAVTVTMSRGIAMVFDDGGSVRFE